MRIQSEPPRFVFKLSPESRVLADFLVLRLPHGTHVFVLAFLLGRWGDHDVLRGNMGVGGFKLLGEVVAFMLLDKCVLFCDACVVGMPYTRETSFGVDRTLEQTRVWGG